MTPLAGLLLGLRCFSRVRRCHSFVQAVRQGTSISPCIESTALRCEGGNACNSFVQAVQQSTSISIQDFTGDLRHRLRTVWKDVEGMNLWATGHK